jgi:hypothetical protein
MIHEPLSECMREVLYLIQHVLNELDLIGDLSTAEDGQERSFWALKRLGEELKLLLDEETSSTLGELDADHAGVCTVCRTKCVVDVHIAEFGQVRAELLDFGRVSLGLVSSLVLYGALLLDMEAKVLKQDDRPIRSICDGLLDLRAHAVFDEGDGLGDLLLELGSDRLEGAKGD